MLLELGGNVHQPTAINTTLRGTVTAPQSVVLALALVLAVWTGCEQPPDSVETTVAVLPAVEPGSGAPSRQDVDTALQEPTADAPPAAPAALGTPATGIDPAAPPDEGPMPDLLAVMRAVGWPEAEPQDLAAYVPVPPASEGQAGQFGSGDQEVGVALIRYPNPRYAQPHVVDVRERLRVAPTLPEAVAMHGRSVLHVRAANRQTAETVLTSIVARLAWPPPTP